MEVKDEGEGESKQVEGRGVSRTGESGRAKGQAQQCSSGTCISTQLCSFCAALPQR